MANATHTTNPPSPDRAATACAALIADADRCAQSAVRRVAVLAEALADAMKEVHGLEYRIQIDHEPNAAFVFIVPRSSKRGRTV